MQIRFPLTSQSTKFQSPAIVEFHFHAARPVPTLSHHKSYRFGRQGAKKHRQWELMPIVGAHSTGFFFRKWLFHDFFASDSRRVDDFCELSQCAYSTESNVYRRTKRIDMNTRQTGSCSMPPPTPHPNQWSVN